MQRWEYARVLVDRGDVSVTYSYGATESRVWPRLINALADLGSEGWELATASNRDGNEVLHFKRPREG